MNDPRGPLAAIIDIARQLHPADLSGACTCDAITGCGDPADAGCPACRRRDPYAPCPRLGFMCWPLPSGQTSCECCTPEQQTRTRHYYEGVRPWTN